MSVENAKAFLSRVASDEAFKKSLENAPNEEARKAIVKEAGYDFTKAEMESLLAADGEGELSDEELEAVAGGNASTVITDIATTISTAVALAG